MKKVYEKNGYTIYEYNPTVFKPFHVNMEPLTWKRRIRLLMAITSGFKVYYLVDGENYAGYCLVQNGKDKRYKFATQNDILVGPYFVSEKYRGKKLSIFLLDFILKKSDIDFENAYDYIGKDNTPSIKASEAVGFEFYSDARLSKYMRTISLCSDDQGEYAIYRYREDPK